MNEKRLEEIKTRLSAADNDGPWGFEYKHNMFYLFRRAQYLGQEEKRTVLHYGAGVLWAIFLTRENAELLANATTYISELIEEIENLQTRHLDD